MSLSIVVMSFQLCLLWRNTQQGQASWEILPSVVIICIPLGEGANSGPIWRQDEESQNSSFDAHESPTPHKLNGSPREKCGNDTVEMWDEW